MLARTLAFTFGIWCLMQFSSLPSLWLIATIPLLLVINRYIFNVQIVLFFFIGFNWALCNAAHKLDSQLEPIIENTDVVIKGVVASVPNVYEKQVRFIFNIDELKTLEGRQFKSPGLVRLSWYKSNIEITPGEIWLFNVKLKRPYGFMNPGGFDYEASMFRKNIMATGYIKPNGQNKKLGESHAYFLQTLRHKIKSKIKQTIEKPLLGFVLALTLGDRSELSPDQWQILSQTGTNHLIAISGLHLSLIAGFIYMFAIKIWSQSYNLTQRIPAPFFASFIAFTVAFIYALLSGFALPAQRALIMISVFLLAMLSVKRISVSDGLCVAIFLVLSLDPFAIIAVDFYLSFMAVAFIFYISRFRIFQFNTLYRWLRLQFLLSIALFPVLILWFKQIPVYSVLANMISIPIIGFIVVPLLLFAILLLFPLPNFTQHIYELVNKVLSFNRDYLNLLAGLDNAVVPIAAPNLFSVIFALIGILTLMMPKGLPARYLALFFFLPLLYPVNIKPGYGEFDFNLLDVGQGLAAVIQTKEHTLVYDSGAKFSKRFNVGDAVIKPYLREKRINKISKLIISHGDNDHIGGAAAIVNNFNIVKILSSVPKVIRKKFPMENSSACVAGQHWHWDGVNFEILHPTSSNILQGNNASCVLKVSSKQGSVLLTGDIEKEAESSLVRQYGEKLQADILLVPHHGSRTSSSNQFLQAVSPDYAFISAGYRNRFGFPKKDIMDRYDAHAVKTLNSYRKGEISAKFRDMGLEIDEFRTKNQRFWHH